MGEGFCDEINFSWGDLGQDPGNCLILFCYSSIFCVMFPFLAFVHSCTQVPTATPYLVPTCNFHVLNQPPHPQSLRKRQHKSVCIMSRDPSFCLLKSYSIVSLAICKLPEFFAMLLPGHKALPSLVGRDWWSWTSQRVVWIPSLVVQYGSFFDL